MTNFFGKYFRIGTFGESHGFGIGVIIDGCPSGLKLNLDDIKSKVDRRAPMSSEILTSRKELDKIFVLSGIKKGSTIGSPIVFFVLNKDCNNLDYKYIKKIPRPSHADYSYYIKYGINSVISGGGRYSARETVARVLAGAIAHKILNFFLKINIIAWVEKVGNINLSSIDYDKINRSDINKYSVKCPNGEIAIDMINFLYSLKQDGDSIGSCITCFCSGIPIGLGRPLYDKLEARLAYSMLSIPGSIGFEFGVGFPSISTKGSLNNKVYIKNDKKIKLEQYSKNGAIQGGISVTKCIVFKVYFKPPSSLGITQKTVDFKGNNSILKISGRHDPCIGPRAVSVVEAMTSIVIVDFAINLGFF